VESDQIEKLIVERNDARNNKNWALADELRKKLLEMNIEILDTKEGTTWKIHN
jgi:cysteinyl-tRNA synthetase